MTKEQQLPKGWKKYNLFDICQPKQWKTIAIKNLINEGYPVYGANGIIGYYHEYNHDVATVLLTCRGATCGEVHISKPYSYINGNAMCMDNLSDNTITEFLYYYLKSINLNFIISGSAQPQITQIGLRKVEIPIPPLETQQAIVNKIESLFDEIDEGIGRLKTAAQQIQQYRQSLLKNAFNGELTKEWRSKHADTLPSENELLAQIKTTREQHHAQQLADWQTAVSQWEQNGKEGKKPSKPKKLKEFNQLEGSFSNLPKGWCWVELSGISSVIRIGPFGSLLHKADYINNQIPLINPSHIKNGKIIPDFQLTVSKEKLNELNNYIMRENDIVIGRRGEMGRCAVVTSNENGWLCGTGSMFVRPLNSVSSKFYAYIISSERVKDYLSNSSIGTTMQNLNEKILQTVPVPLCSTQEQLEILRILDVNLTACDQLAAELSKQLKQAELLKQAVLKAAFSGSLLDK